MAATLTDFGKIAALNGGGFAANATRVRLYSVASNPDAFGNGIVEVATGYGYTIGGISVSVNAWAIESGSGFVQLRLAGCTWTATGGTIQDVAGAYITDEAGKVLAWIPRSTPASIPNGSTVSANNLIIKLV